jgi:hypothetical protein
MLLSLNGKLDSENMLTSQSTCFVIRTCTVRSFGIGAHGVAPMTGLRWDEPYPTFVGQCAGRGDLLPTAFAFKEFLLDIFPYRALQNGLLDGDPEKAS